MSVPLNPDIPPSHVRTQQRNPAQDTKPRPLHTRRGDPTERGRSPKPLQRRPGRPNGARERPRGVPRETRSVPEVAGRWPGTPPGRSKGAPEAPPSPPGAAPEPPREKKNGALGPPGARAVNKAIPEAPPRGPKGTLGVRVENLRVNVNKHTCFAPHILGVIFLRQAPDLARRGLSSTAPAHKI